MFNYFSNLKDSCVHVEGNDIDIVFNELVDFINDMEDRIDFILQDISLKEYDDGYIKLDNNEVSTTININEKKSKEIDLDKITSANNGHLVGNDKSFIKTVKLKSESAKYVKLNQKGPLLCEKELTCNKQVVLKNHSYFKDNLLNLNHINWNSLKSYLIKRAYDKLNLDEDTSKEVDIDFTKLTPNEVRNLISNVEIPDSAFSDSSIPYWKMGFKYKKISEATIIKYLDKFPEIPTFSIFSMSSGFIDKVVKDNKLIMSEEQITINTDDYWYNGYTTNQLKSNPVYAVDLQCYAGMFLKNSLIPIRYAPIYQHSSSPIPIAYLDLIPDKKKSVLINKYQLSAEIKTKLGM